MSIEILLLLLLESWLTDLLKIVQDHKQVHRSQKPETVEEIKPVKTAESFYKLVRMNERSSDLYKLL